MIYIEDVDDIDNVDKFEDIDDVDLTPHLTVTAFWQRLHISFDKSAQKLGRSAKLPRPRKLLRRLMILKTS